MKVKITFKNIFLRTSAMFFIFYFIVVAVFTGIYYKILVDGNKLKFDNMLSVVQENVSKDIYEIGYEKLSEGRTEYSINDESNPEEKEKERIKLTELNAYMTYLTSNFSKEMFAKSYLYDENYKTIAKSRDLLRITNTENDESVHLKRQMCIDLDKYLSDDEKMELFKIDCKKNSSQQYLVKVQGYVSGNEIIPEVMEIYENKIDDGPESVDECMKRAEKIKTFNFDVQGVEGLKKINISDYLDSHWEIHYSESIYHGDNSDELLEKIFQRYNNFKEYSEEEIRDLSDARNGYEGVKSNTNKKMDKVTYDYINTLTINNHKYYLVLQADYYPWEDMLPKAIPLYLISFIMVLAMTIILSRGLYKTYAKQEALERNRRKLTSAIAHELKTPLGIIRTYGEGLKENIAEDKKDKYLDVIIDETYRMDKMVLEMLDLSKLEAKAYELKKEELCLNDLIEEIIKRNEKVFSDKSININYRSDKKYNINADYTRIEQVINNLLSNAIYHTAENKVINIQINNEEFTIENEGEHIPKDKMNLIWDSFYRGDNSRDRSQVRTGIGLAIVKNILELHNFEFGAENTVLGVKFWFKF